MDLPESNVRKMRAAGSSGSKVMPLPVPQLVLRFADAKYVALD